MQKICFFKDYLCAIPQSVKEGYLASADVQIVRRMKLDDIDVNQPSLTPGQIQDGYRQMVEHADNLFGIDAPDFLYSIGRNRDERWFNIFAGQYSRFFLKVIFEQDRFAFNIRLWALHPSNWFLVESSKSDYQLEAEISAEFPCLVFDNVPVEIASPGLEVNLQNIEQVLHATGIYQLWKSGAFGETSKVTVLDTGVSDTIASQPGVTAESSDPGLDVYDTDGHGSAMIEMIKAISPKCEIHSLKVIDSWKSHEIIDVIAGLISFGGKVGHIACMALTIQDNYLQARRGAGSSIKQSITHLLSGLANNQNFPICSSGNSGTANLLWPSACKYALAVGAHNMSGQISSFSNHDVSADNFILAPGGDARGSSFTYETFGKFGSGKQQLIYGTSFSTAITAGVSALLLQYPWFSTMQIPSRISLFRNHCKKNSQGFPILNVADIGAIWPI